MKSSWFYTAGIMLSLWGLLGLTQAGSPPGLYLTAPRDDTLYITDSNWFDSCHQARPICGAEGLCVYIPLNNVVYSLGQCCKEDSIASGYWPVTCCIDYNSLVYSYPVNPHWYFFKVEEPGSLVIQIWSTPNIAFTWIMWGPFDTPHGACMDGLIGTTHLISSGYTNYVNPDTVIITIPNAEAGEYYLLNIGKGGYATYMHIQQTNAGQPGAAVLSCDIVYHCSIFQISAIPGPCDEQTNTFTVTGEIYFSNPPSTGYLVVYDSATGYASLNTPPFVSPYQYSIPGLPCDNQLHQIHAAFWDSVGCENTIVFQAPVLCPHAHISGGGEICDNNLDSVGISIQFTPNVQLPITFAWKYNGVPQPPITTSGPFPYTFYTRQPGLYTLDTSYNASCAGQVSGQASVVAKPLPIVDLGNDMNACQGRSVVLDAGPGFLKYIWSTDETTQTIEVGQSGTFWVMVQGSNGCYNSDTISINFVPSPGPLLIKHQ
ncbi:MAG: hypothetical protein ACP5O2_06110 [Bacteroidales bacterium]